MAACRDNRRIAPSGTVASAGRRWSAHRPVCVVRFQFRGNDRRRSAPAFLHATRSTVDGELAPSISAMRGPRTRVKRRPLTENRLSPGLERKISALPRMPARPPSVDWPATAGNPHDHAHRMNFAVSSRMNVGGGTIINCHTPEGREVLQSLAMGSDLASHRPPP